MRRDLLVLVLGLMLLFALPMTTAESPSYPAASVVGPGDPDQVPQLLPLKGQTCYRESTGNSAYDPGESVYLDVLEAVCALNTKENDVRLTPSGSHAAGSKVGAGDADFNEPLETDVIGAGYHYRDLDASGGWTRGDALYLDMDADLVAEPGDVRLTAHGSKAAGTLVGLTDADHLATLASGAFADDQLRFWDLDGDAAFGPADVVFLDADKDSAAEAGDVYVTALLDRPFGSTVSATQFYPPPTFLTPGAAWCYIDSDGDSALDPQETILLDLAEANCSHGVDASDLRLTRSGAAGDLSAFTFPSTSDDDFNDKVRNLTAAKLRHHEQEGGAQFGAGDVLYLDVNDDEVVTVGDVRLGRFGDLLPGRHVTANDNDGGADLRDPPAFAKEEVLVWDANGDSKPGAGDVVYLDMDDDGRIEVNDVRLTGLPSSVLEGIAPVETAPPPSAPPSPPASSPPPSAPPPASSGDGFEDAESEGSPAGAWLVLLGLLGAAFARRRRSP